MSAFVGAIAIADLVKTTLGPKGMDKILQSVRTSHNEHSEGKCLEPPPPGFDLQRGHYGDERWRYHPPVHYC